MTDPLTEAVARALAKSHGLDFDEVCGVDASPDDGYCDSGTCIAAHYEDHDAAYARACYLSDARTAIAAMREQLVPVAWMYARRGCQPYLTRHRHEDWLAEGSTETPVYAFPAAPTEGEG